MRLPVNILNTSREASMGPFTKLGFIETQTDSTLTEVRQTLIERFDLNGRFFVFEDAQMMDIIPSKEDDVIVGDTFSVSVIIKMIVNQGIYLELKKTYLKHRIPRRPSSTNAQNNASKLKPVAPGLNIAC